MIGMPMMFADGIDIPMVLIFGLAVLTPLMLFQVTVESAVLARVWEMRFGDLTRFVFSANLASLVAGIPTKILNMVFYGLALPWDNLPVFFRRYPWAVAIGTLLYFVVTVLVESWRAFVWKREAQLSLTQRDIWRGMLLANLATYLVLAPAHYFLTRPITDVREFTEGAAWANEPNTRILMLEPGSLQLKVCRMDGTSSDILVADAVKDYLISDDLQTLLYRGTNGGVQLVRRDVGRTNTVPGVNSGALAMRTAFSSDGQWVASVHEKHILVFNTLRGNASTFPLPRDAENISIAWTTNDDAIALADGGGRSWLGQLTSERNGTASNSLALVVATTPVHPALNRVFAAPPRRRDDTCGDFRTLTVPGLTSSLRIFRSGVQRENQFTVSVNPGIMHLGSVPFVSALFLEDCNNCVFEAGNAVYLLDIAGRRAGRIASGTRPLPMTDRFVQQFDAGTQKDRP